MMSDIRNEFGDNMGFLPGGYEWDHYKLLLFYFMQPDLIFNEH